MSLARVALARITGALLVIFGVVTVTFLLTRVVSPDPTGLFVSPTADAAERAKVREALGLSNPIPVQFISFLNNLLHGNLGDSFTTSQPVVADLVRRFPATAELALYALVAGTFLGIDALLPVVTMLAGVVGWAFSGAVLVEGVFGWPGIGQYALSAIQASDFPAIQGFVLLAAIVYVIIYQLLELAYSAIDPRIRS